MSTKPIIPYEYLMGRNLAPQGLCVEIEKHEAFHMTEPGLNSPTTDEQLFGITEGLAMTTYFYTADFSIEKVEKDDPPLGEWLSDRHFDGNVVIFYVPKQVCEETQGSLSFTRSCLSDGRLVSSHQFSPQHKGDKPVVFIYVEN